MCTPRHSKTFAYVLVGTCGMFLSAGPAAGHVILDEPNGGDFLDVGSVFIIEWHIDIAHALLNWDLWYSTTGEAGPWIAIEMDLPPGSLAVGSMHSYDWTVPDDPSDQVRVRVRMDNAATDYFDISDANLTIATTHHVVQVGLTFDPADIIVAPGDMVEWHWADGIHTVTSGPPCTPDGRFNDPLDVANQVVTYTIPSNEPGGVIPYFCIPHCLANMTGTITVLAPPIRAPAPHEILKNRYISIDPRGVSGTNPSSHHIRVMVDSSEVIGLVGSGPWWATAPVSSGPADCISVLSNDKPAVEPDWSACPTVHLTGCPIIPTTTYAITAESGGTLSADALLDTQAKPGFLWYGDCVGFFDGTILEWTAPNGVVNAADFQAAIFTFQDPNAFNATHVSVTDMQPNLDGAQINLIVNIADVFAIILGFQGREYPGADLTMCGYE